MSYSNRPPPVNGNINTWGERLNDWLVRNRSKLAYYLTGQPATEDGILLWDAANSKVLVSSNGSWVDVGAGGGGSITNYLRDDADDTTSFRLTMGGLTVDTNTLYVDSVNNEVGIGTTNPSEKLEVVGNVEATEFIGDLRGAVVFKAQAGEALAIGDVVYISGISGNTTVVNKADADDAAKMPAFGLAANTVSNNTNVEIYTFGTLAGLDTSSYTEGDELFVSTTAGALVSTAPTGEGSLVQKIGKVTRSHGSAGSIKIMGAGRTNATPNLDDGNIFIGDSNNVATTASFATEVANATTGKADLSGADFTGDVTTTGNVGIGTSSPKQQLHISGGNQDGDVTKVAIGATGANAETHLQLAERFTGNDMNYGFSFVADGNDTNNLLIKNHNNSTTGAVALSVARTSGNVGIGTDSPTGNYTKTLHIHGSNTGASLHLTDPTSGATASDGLEVFQYGTDGYVWEREAGSLRFGTSALERMRIDASGNVGIGTDNPTEALDIDGNIAVSGTVDGVDVSGLETTVAGKADLSGATFTGTITAPNVDISTTGSVTTNIATGTGGPSNTKTVNIATGYSTGGTTTVNIAPTSSTTTKQINLNGNVSVDGTVDGRDVAADGTKLDGIATNATKNPYHRIRYDKLRHTSLELYLTTTHQNISQASNIVSPATPVKCARYIDIQTEVEWRYVSSATNDLAFRLEYFVPTSNATVTNLGTATAGTFTGFSRDTYEAWFYVSGDYTHLLTEFGRMNKTGVSGATEMQARAWYYDTYFDRTYILTDSNPGISVSSGDTIYWHPYAWESAGTLLYVEDQIDERYVSIGRQNITLRYKTAYDDSRINYRAFMREMSSADSAIIYRVKATLTEIEEV